jgi:hypothetical protein
MAAAEAPPVVIGITDKIKERQDFKEFIGYIARSDAEHDFGGTEGNGIVYTSTVAGHINKGLTDITNRDITNEKGSMWNVFIELGGVNQADKERALDAFLDGLSDTAFGEEFNVGFRDVNDSENPPIALHRYRARRIDMVDGLSGDALKEACDLQGGGALVIDFNHNGFLEKLHSATAQAQPIYVITNPQTMNDAAGKTKYNDPIFTGSLLSIIDRKAKPTIYSAWSDEDISINNLFLTSYQLELTPIIIVKSIMGKAQKLTVNITVTDLTKEGKPKSVIKDAKVNNSKGEIWKKIKSIFRSFKDKSFEINEGLQRKRNGDWGQGTSCFTLDEGIYYESDLSTLIEGLTFDTNTVYFVTHDYIAAAYANLIGANLIFLAAASRGNPKRAYIFKNTKYMGNSAEYMRSILEYNPVGAASTDKIKVLTALKLYNTTRNDFLNIYIQPGQSPSRTQSSIIEEITKLNALLNDRNIDSAALKNQCLAILDRAYLYQQIKQSTPDPSILISELEVATPRNATDPGNSAIIEKQYSAYCTGKNIKKIYDNNRSFLDIANNIKKSNIYLSLKHWTYTKEKRGDGGISKRLGIKVGASGASIDNQDKFAFVPFLATCDDNIKNQIVDVFRALLTKLQGPQFIEGRESGSIYQHALLSFKILCETICIFLGTTTARSEPQIFNKLINIKDITQRDTLGAQANLLSEAKVVDENSETNRATIHIVDSEAQPVAGESGAGGQPAASALEIALSENDVNAEEPLQRGGVFKDTTRLLNHNSIKESTHVMLSAHLLLIPTTGVAAAAGGAAVRSARNEYNTEDPDYNLPAIGGGNTDEIFSPGLPIYTVLEGLRVAVPELNNHPDYEDYITYYLLLESMNDTLKTQSSPLIGFALREILATFISTQIGRDTIKPLFESLGPDYRLFPLIATTTSAYVCGSFVEYDEGKPEVIDLAKLVIQCQPVKDFIASVIAIYKTKTRAEFYIDGNHNLQNFMNKVNRLQESIGRGIVGKEVKSVAQLLQERGITAKNIQRFMNSQTRRTVYKRTLNRPNRANKPNTRRPLAVAGKRRTQRKK